MNPIRTKLVGYHCELLKRQSPYIIQGIKLISSRLFQQSVLKSEVRKETRVPGTCTNTHLSDWFTLCHFPVFAAPGSLSFSPVITPILPSHRFNML